MKRAAYAVAAVALTAAAPAIALPNAFWTFGWDFPGRGKPWTIGQAKGRKGVTQMAATPAVAAPPATAEPAGGETMRFAALDYDLAGL